MPFPELGISIIKLDPEPSDRTLGVLAESQVSMVEIADSLLGAGHSRDERLALYKRWTPLGGLRASSVHARFGPQVDLSSEDRVARSVALESVRRSIDAASVLGASVVVVHASSEPIEIGERSVRLEHACRSLQELSESCSENGVRLAVELLPRTCLGNSVSELRSLLDGLDPKKVGACLDTNHLTGRIREVIPAFLALHDRLLSIHVSDYHGDDEEHLMPGAGAMDWASFAQAIREIEYRGLLTYECRFTDESLEERVSLIEENYVWLKSID